MAFNGSGTYNLPAGNPVVTNTIISSVWANGTMNDIASALSICFTRDGQAPAAANIPMGNHKLTGLAQATLDGDALAWGGNASIADLTVTGTMSGAGVSSYLTNSLASPPAIGNTTPNTVKGTTVTATTQFTGPATGLTGTASGLSIGGNAATATNATNATNATTTTTAAKFTNSTAIASTAFVQDALGNYSGVASYTTTATQPQSDFGKIIYGSSATPFTLTLPSATGVPAGSAITYVVTNNGAVTLSAPSGAIYVNGASSATLKLLNWMVAQLMWDGTNWVCTTGSVTQACKAWVNFNGTTSPGTIRASFNVSSVTKNGTGDYTINFTNAMPDANYSVAGATGSSITATTSALSIAIHTLTSASARLVKTAGSGGTAYDADTFTVSFFR